MDPKGTLSSFYPPSIIVMPRFSWQKKVSDDWYSKPFYSAPGGYKLCLSVDANGLASGKCTHISVFVFLMKGENDDCLQWPFQHYVTFGILNWKRDESHVIKTINFKTAPQDSKDRVTSGQKAIGWGFSKFLPHSSLSDSADKNTQYLYQDCLCLQVLKVEARK